MRKEKRSIESFHALPPSVIKDIVRICEKNEINSLQAMFSELGDGWRRAVMRDEINDFFWGYGNAITYLYSHFKNESIDNFSCFSSNKNTFTFI